MSPEFQKELLDDFYAECDEHLANARAQLAALERAQLEDRADAEALQSLFRSMHSFKGISAIVGLRCAEALAHAAEGVLRGPSRTAMPLPPAAMELLAQSIHRLEQIVAAHRLDHPLPDAADLVGSLDALAPSVQPAGGADGGNGGARSTPASAPTPPPVGEVWRAAFSPSAELDRRGININTVRTRLSGLGEILSAVPVIRPDGSMAFNFTVAAHQIPQDLPDWEANGIVLGKADPAEIPPAEVKRAERPAPADTGPTNLFISPSHIVRVDLSRLDDLMRIAGEMVIHRSRLEERIARVTGDRTALQEVNIAFGRSLRELREAITRVRLVSVAEIFTRMPFVVRDLARDTGRKVRLLVEGQNTEIDKYVVERLKEPLLHLVRNAVSHGVESPAERVAAGKSEEATLRLAAAASGQSVVIQIRDDGRGIDPRRIAARAGTLGIEISDTPTDAELLAVLCHPGFSTREEADLASGRGVGMAVVQNTVRELGGTLSMGTQPGSGTQFTLRLPLTLSIAETFLVSAAGHTCAVPTGFVEEVVLSSAAQVRTIQQAEVMPYRGGILPLVRLARLFGATGPVPAQQPILVLTSDRGLCGLVVDRVHGQREVVVRAIHDPLVQVPGVSGATELGDGRPVLILDAVALSAGAVRPRTHSTVEVTGREISADRRPTAVSAPHFTSPGATPPLAQAAS